MKLDYRLHPEQLTAVTKKPMEEASASDLRYYYFPGDIILTHDEVDLSARWGWVQILDFVIALRMIATDLTEGSSIAFDFTESSETLVFALNAGLVNITASYAEGVIECDWEHFKKITAFFYERVLSDLLVNHPELKQNTNFMTLLGA